MSFLIMPIGLGVVVVAAVVLLLEEVMVQAAVGLVAALVDRILIACDQFAKVNFFEFFFFIFPFKIVIDRYAVLLIIIAALLALQLAFFFIIFATRR